MTDRCAITTVWPNRSPTRDLALPDRERDAFIAEPLARLLEPAADEFVESDEWVREIERRLQGVVSGETVCEDWDVVEQRLLAKYPKV